MNIIIRNYQIDDLLNAANELKEAFKEEPWNEEWSIDQAMSRISAIMDSTLSRGYVAINKENNEIVGILLGRLLPMLDFYEYWIDDFSTLPKYHGNGIGTKLLEYAKSSLNKDTLHVKTFNLVTRKTYPCYDYYLKHGFINDGFNTFLHLDL